MSIHSPLIGVRFPTDARILNTLLLIATITFLFGIFAPILTFNRLYIFSNTISLFSGLISLLKEGQVVLFLIILSFSIILPAIKLGFLFIVLNKRTNNNDTVWVWLHWMEQYGKWSMLDVFIVAILLVTIKLRAIANVEVHYGLYAFTVSVVITMFVTHRVIRLIKTVAAKAGRSPPT